MLQSLTDGIQGSKWLRWIIILAISVPFALWGISSYFDAYNEDYVASVNGTEIKLQQYQREYNQQRQRLAQNFGGRVPEMFAGDFLKNETLNSMIQQELLLQTVANQGYRLGNDVLGKKITEYEAFKAEGVFDKDRYQRYLQSVGMSAAQFEDTVRKATLVTQMRNGVVETAFVAPSLAGLTLKLKEQTRSFSLIDFSADQYQATIELTDAEIQEFFDAHAERYMTPEAVKLEYLELNAADFAKKIEADDAQLRAMYADEQQRFLDQEQRQASHILIKLDDKAAPEQIEVKRQEAEDLRQQILAGASFSDLAKGHSDDAGSAASGGELGQIQRGVMVKPFEDALFAMTEGDVSEPVRTTFGWHLIRLEKITAPQQKPFEEVRDELLTEYRQREADDLFFEHYDLLANGTYENSETLSVAAEQTTLPVLVSDWVERDQGQGIGALPEIRQAAFSDKVFKENANSDVIEIGNNHVLVLRVKEKRASQAKNLDEVKPDVVSQLKMQRAKEQAKTFADQALAAVQSGKDISEVAKDFKLQLTQIENAKRSAAQPSTQLVSAVFSMPKPMQGQFSYERLETPSGYAVVALREVQEVTGSDVSTQAEVEIDQLSQSMGSAEYAAWLASLKAKAKILRKPELL